MEHKITLSKDGSNTLQLSRFNEAYHSTNGAYTEAMHIYIQKGVEHLFNTLGKYSSSTPSKQPCISIFDVGFGTGLNCILLYAWQQSLRENGLPYPAIRYWGIEKYPIQPIETQLLNYPHIIGKELNLHPDSLQQIYNMMHSCAWETDMQIAQEFTLHKSCTDIAAVTPGYYLNACQMPAVIFYDTFSPATQPELWDESIFQTMASGCPKGSVLVTYCSKGTVKQALRNAGFTIERLAGPPGKRHILRATI